MAVHTEEISSNLLSLVLLLAEKDVDTKILCKFINSCFVDVVVPVQIFVQLHLTQVSNTEFHKVGKVDLTIRI